jgi:hypothetical protein
VGLVKAAEDITVGLGIFQGGGFANNDIGLVGDHVDLMLANHQGPFLTPSLNDIRGIDVGGDIVGGLLVVWDIGVALGHATNGRGCVVRSRDRRARR